MLTREELLVIYRNLENPKLDQESVINAMAKAVEVALEKALVPTMFWGADKKYQELTKMCHELEQDLDEAFDFADQVAAENDAIKEVLAREQARIKGVRLELNMYEQQQLEVRALEAAIAAAQQHQRDLRERIKSALIRRTELEEYKRRVEQELNDRNAKAEES